VGLERLKTVRWQEDGKLKKIVGTIGQHIDALTKHTQAPAFNTTPLYDIVRKGLVVQDRQSAQCLRTEEKPHH
jgi:hypothetical protein